MTEEKFVRLVWTCPNCGVRNPGPQRSCTQCGTPQPPDVEFGLPAQAEVVTDTDEIEAARRGADIHCTYCGTRNPANATHCSQCGADLSEGQVRRAGGELSPISQEKHTCPACSYENTADARFCRQCGAPLEKSAPAFAPPSPSITRKRKSPFWLFALLGLLLACAGLFALFITPTKQVEGVVTSVHWRTEVVVQELVPVRYEDEIGNPPFDAYDVSCRDETKQVCEEKTIDLGNGYAQVVQECRDETERYCSYTRDEWRDRQRYTMEGNDLSPRYAQPALTGKQRLGTPRLTMTVYFDTPSGEKTYTLSDLSAFQQFTPGSRWRLQLNALGGIVTVQPLR